MPTTSSPFPKAKDCSFPAGANGTVANGSPWLPAESIEVPFRPPWYLRSGHLQTILGPYVLRRLELPNTKRWKVPLPVGEGFTYLYESTPSKPHEEAASGEAILLIHGLGGDHSSPYLTRIGSQLLEQGRRVIRIDLPGCGASAPLSDRAAHAGCTREIESILEWASNELHVQRWQIAGFSLGGNITLKLLADRDSNVAFSPNRPPITRSVVVAPPMDLAYCCSLIESGFNQVYNRFFLRILKRLTKERMEHWPVWRELHQRCNKPIRTIREFDDAFTSQIGGFRDAADYYAQCSTIDRIQEIATPTSILMDHHDPIVPARMLDRIGATKFISTASSRWGGHIGYFHQVPGKRLRCWMDEWVVSKLTDPQVLHNDSSPL